MPTVRLSDIELYYEMRGTGARLLVIGGTGWDLRRAPTMFHYPIAKHFELLCYDQRGQGRSGKPDLPYSMADYAHDAKALLDALGWPRCHVLGISFGGMVAQEFALRYPERVERLVLGCTSSGGAGGASYPLHTLADLPEREYARAMVTLGDTRRDAAWQAGNAQEFEGMVEFALRRGQIGADEPGYREGFKRQLEARRAHDCHSRLPQLTMPVLVCGGRFDGIAPPDNLEALWRQIPGARFGLFEGGHLFYQQDPRAFQEIASFLA